MLQLAIRPEFWVYTRNVQVIFHCQTSTLTASPVFPFAVCASDSSALMAMYKAWGSPMSLSWGGGPVPCQESWIGVYCTNEVITSLDISGRSGVSGPLDPAFGSLTGLIDVNFGNCNMSGSLPPQMSLLSALTSLSLTSQGVGFTGPVPAQLSVLTNMVLLYMDSNNLSGTIPLQLSKLTSLQRLALHDNMLTGALPLALSSLYASIGGGDTPRFQVYDNGGLCGPTTGFPNIMTQFTLLGQSCPAPPRELPVLHLTLTMSYHLLVCLLQVQEVLHSRASAIWEWFWCWS